MEFAFRYIDYTALNGRVILNDTRMWQEVVMTYYILWHDAWKPE
jgi:hypothetical protein